MVSLLSQMVRLTAIVAASVAAGLLVAYGDYVLDLDGDAEGIVGLFATFTVPIIVAWLLLQIHPFSPSQAADSEDTPELHGTIEPPTKTDEGIRHPLDDSPGVR